MVIDKKIYIINIKSLNYNDYKNLHGGFFLAKSSERGSHVELLSTRWC